MLADCHTHLGRYAPGTIDGMLERAGAAGVGLVIGAGSDLASSRRGVRLARARPILRAGVGLHPLSLRGPVDAAVYAQLAELAAGTEVVAWSEAGLDYTGRATASEQRAVLRQQLLLARELGLAAIVHAVDAAADMIALLGETGMAARSAIHYFVGGPALADRYLAAGLLLSVGKPVTRSENAALRGVVRDLPLDRLLLETDTYPLPGRTTEPRDVRLIAAAVAELKGIDQQTVAAVTTANLARLLGPTRWPAHLRSDGDAGRGATGP